MGIGVSSTSPTIIGNNIYNNGYNLYLEQAGTNNINATYNWWGTTDTQAINQTIYDFKDNFNLGAVTFVPFLTATNSEAMPNPNVPIPTQTPATPTPTTNSTSTPNPSLSSTSTTTSTPTTTSTLLHNPVYEILIIVLVVLIVAFAVVMAVLMRGRRR